MKEKIRKIFPKSLPALAIVLAMVVTLLPGMSMTVKAETPLDSHVCANMDKEHYLITGENGGDFDVDYYRYSSGSWESQGVEFVDKKDFPEGAAIGDGKAYIDVGEPGHQNFILCDPYNVWVAGTQITGQNKGDVLGDKTVSYDPDTNTLTLNGATITGSNDSEKIGIKSREDLNIVLKGNNIIGSAADWEQSSPTKDDYAVIAGISTPDNALKISGDGSLTIYDYENGIWAKNISFGTAENKFNGTLTIRDYGGAVSYCGINTKGVWDSNVGANIDGDINIYGGTFDIISKKSNGIKSDGGNVTIKDVKKIEIKALNDGLSISDVGDITIDNSNVEIAAVDDEGDTATPDGIYVSDGGLTITNSTISVLARASNSDWEANGINVDGMISISGKNSNVTATGITNQDGSGVGIRSDEAVSITDGYIKAKGSTCAIMTYSETNEKQLVIGDASKPMTIKNAKRVLDVDNFSDCVEITEGRGGIDSIDEGDDYYTILLAADGTGYVEIGTKSGGNTPIIPIVPPTTPDIQVDGDGSIDVSGTISGNTVTVGEITKDSLDKIVQDDSKNTAISIDLSKNTGITSATLTKTSAEAIAEVLSDKANSKDELVIKTPTAEVSIDATALSSIAKQAKGEEIRLVVENKSQGALNASQQGQLNGKVVEKTFEAYFVSGGSRISNFSGGKVTIGKVDFKLPAGKNPKHYHVEFLPASGKAVRHNTWFKDGILFFDTTHLSDYVIVYDETTENGGPSAAQIAINTLKLNKGLKVSQTGSKVNVKWGKASADGYLVYASYCGKSLKKIKTIEDSAKTSYSFSKLDGKAIDLTKNIKVVVKAYVNIDGKKVECGKSIGAHVIGVKNAKYSNPKSITIAKKSVSLNTGKTHTIKATVNLTDASKNALPASHVKKLRYASNNEAVATVNAAGKITANSAGTATVYVYAANGYTKSVKVTVK